MNKLQHRRRPARLNNKPAQAQVKKQHSVQDGLAIDFPVTFSNALLDTLAARLINTPAMQQLADQLVEDKLPVTPTASSTDDDSSDVEQPTLVPVNKPVVTSKQQQSSDTLSDHDYSVTVKPLPSGKEDTDLKALREGLKQFQQVQFAVDQQLSKLQKRLAKRASAYRNKPLHTRRAIEKRISARIVELKRCKQQLAEESVPWYVACTELTAHLAELKKKAAEAAKKQGTSSSPPRYSKVVN